MGGLELQHICKRYPGAAREAIKDACLSIGDGEFCVIIGPSGCGKTTLLRMIAGLETVTSGDILFDGTRINDRLPSKRNMAMVFQNYALYPHMNVFDNMAFGLRSTGASKSEITEKINKAAEILQLTSLLQRLPKALSGGQRQRVAIGRAIVKKPRLFLFDEPLSNLDAALRANTRLEIAKLHRQIPGSSCLYVTHDQVEAMTLADTIVLLHAGDEIASRGSVAQIGAPMELYHHPDSRFVAEFIGSPKINMLSGRLLESGIHGARIELSGGTVDVPVDALHLPINSPVDLGIRPEYVHFSSHRPGFCLAATIEHLERLGDSSIVYARTNGDGSMLTIRLNGDTEVEKKDWGYLSFAPTHIHVFAADGMRCSAINATS